MENAHPNPEQLQRLRAEVARLSGSSLPEPLAERWCDDCQQHGTTFPLGRGSFCVECWTRRDAVRQRIARAA